MSQLLACAKIKHYNPKYTFQNQVLRGTDVTRCTPEMTPCMETLRSRLSEKRLTLYSNLRARNPVCCTETDVFPNIVIVLVKFSYLGNKIGVVD